MEVKGYTTEAESGKPGRRSCPVLHVTFVYPQDSRRPITVMQSLRQFEKDLEMQHCFLPHGLEISTLFASKLLTSQPTE
jgi:hypothetical protein